jgi:hypothetical protein
MVPACAYEHSGYLATDAAPVKFTPNLSVADVIDR